MDPANDIRVEADIALLAPAGTDLWRYERALEENGIPVASQAGKGFFRRQEIQDLIAITRTLSDSRDTVAFGALMRGPLVGLTEEEIRGVYLRQSSMRKFASTDDIANMVLFLASENAKHISGQIIAVDGHTECLSNWLD